jgi:hypothetical protein
VADDSELAQVQAWLGEWSAASAAGAAGHQCALHAVELALADGGQAGGAEAMAF